MQRKASAKRIVEEAIKKGYTITKKALDLLQSAEAPLQILNEAIDKLEEETPKTLLIDERLIEELLKPSEKPCQESVREEDRGELEVSIEIEVDERYLREWRIQGSLAEFQKHFRNRYEKISRILRERLGAVTDVLSALKLREGQDAYIIAAVLEKSESKKAWILRVDDPSSEATIIAPKNGDVASIAEKILPDSVIGFKVQKHERSLIAREIFLPEIALRNVEKTDLDAYACLISDIHVGSKHFREDLFESFLDWLNREGDPEARKTRVLIIAGDAVDGIGVYPNQDKELEITSIDEQFRRLSRLLAEIPEHVTIMIGVGNHEPVQKALPQPPLQEKYRSILKRSGRQIVFLGNPAWIKLSGRPFLVYHGQGLDDVIQIIPGFSHSTLKNDIGKVLELLIRHRHLCPIHGESTPLLPTEEDLLVVDKIPSVFHSGHVHVAYAGSYQGIRMINSGTWQEQTSYQRNVGLEPTVGTAILVNLGDLSIKMKKFV